jgi:DNA polymerase-3 subunit beta
MKFSCEKNILVSAISVAQKAVSSKSTLVVLEGILLRAFDQQLTLSSNNMELSIDYNMEATIEEEGSIVVNARLFGDIIRRLPQDLVFFETKENNLITIHSGNASFDIMGLPADEFPQAQQVDRSNYMEISQKLFKSMISKTIFSVATVDLKPILTGVLFDFHGSTLNLVAIDGYRLARRSIEVENTNITAQFVIPAKTLNELLKLLTDSDDPVTLYVDKQNILFVFPQFTLISRLLEGEFLNYDAIIPKEFRIEAIVDTKTFIASIERASLIVSGEFTKTPLRVNIAEHEITLNCSAQMGKATDSFSAQVTGGDLEIGFNFKYLLDALGAVEEPETKVLFNMSLNPCIIRPLEGDDYLYMILPIRLA